MAWMLRLGRNGLDPPSFLSSRGGAIGRSLNIDVRPPRAHPKAQAWGRPDFGNLGTWKLRHLESKQISRMKILKIKIHVAQNVGKVWIGRGGGELLGPISPQAIFSIGRNNIQNMVTKKKTHIFLGGWPIFWMGVMPQSGL